jgi:hypothetical protein
MIIEVIEETVGLDKIKEHSPQLTLALDLLFFDGGFPLLTSKPLLLSLLKPPSHPFSPSLTDSLAYALKYQ